MNNSILARSVVIVNRIFAVLRRNIIINVVSTSTPSIMLVLTLFSMLSALKLYLSLICLEERMVDLFGIATDKIEGGGRCRPSN